MRRTRFILALIAAVSAVTIAARPAGAHFCSIPVEVNVGEEVTVNVGVAAEEKPVRDVEIEIPAGFTLKESFGYLGYVGETRGKWVRFTGAEIAPYTCHYFALQGEATKKGRLVSRIVTTAPDGTRTRFEDTKPGALFPAMQIFAGVKIADFAQRDDGGFPAWAAPLVALLAGAGAVAVAVLVRRRVTMRG